MSIQSIYTKEEKRISWQIRDVKVKIKYYQDRKEVLKKQLINLVNKRKDIKYRNIYKKLLENINKI